jgi:hypothetical protein
VKIEEAFGAILGDMLRRHRGARPIARRTARRIYTNTDITPESLWSA